MKHYYTGYQLPREELPPPKARCHKHSHWRDKLTAEQVLEIRALCAAKVEARWRIAVKFGISEGTLSGIVTRKTWSHLPI